MIENSTNSSTIHPVQNTETVEITNIDTSNNATANDQSWKNESGKICNTTNSICNNTSANVTNPETAILRKKILRPCPFCKLLGYHQCVCKTLQAKYNENL